MFYGIIIWQDPEYCQRQRERMIGDKNPSKLPEVQQKISKKLKGREAPWCTGIPKSEETRKKMSEAQKGKPRGPNPAIAESNRRRAGETRKKRENKP